MFTKKKSVGIDPRSMLVQRSCYRASISKQCKPRLDTTERGVWSESAMFVCAKVYVHIYSDLGLFLVI